MSDDYYYERPSVLDEYPGPDMPDEEAEQLLSEMGKRVDPAIPHDALLLDFTAEAAVNAMERHWGNG